MDADSRAQAEGALRRIRRDDWTQLFDDDLGSDLLRRRQAVRDALAAADLLRKGAVPRPIGELLDLYGDRLLLDGDLGPWIRQRWIESLPPTKWSRLKDHYIAYRGTRADKFHGNMTQHGTGARVLADYWHHGGRWAQSFCEVTGLPLELAQRRRAPVRHDEEIIPAEPLPPLHDFQIEVYRSMRRVLAKGTGKAAMLSLPMGAGKTRVAVEAICDHLATRGERSRARNVIIWLRPEAGQPTQHGAAAPGCARPPTTCRTCCTAIATARRPSPRTCSRTERAARERYAARWNRK